jgi:hypothetical protein
MNRKLSIFLTLIACLAIAFSTGGQARASSSSAAAFTYYLTIWGHEGIGTVGSGLTTHGAAPSVGDYASTHCRYINVATTGWGDYYLNYPIHVPNGVTITAIKAYIADFSVAGNAYVHMVKRTWNSAGAGSDFTPSIGTNSTTGANQLVSTGAISEVVNNQTTQYWIEITPVNTGDPGQLCVYSLQVTYTSPGALLPMINNGG